MALISDIVVASFITGSLALASVVTPLYIRNKRALKRGILPAEEFIERFMKRQEQEIEHKNRLIIEMENSIQRQVELIKRLEGSIIEKDGVIKELRGVVKQLRLEIRKAKAQTDRSLMQLNKMKREFKELKN